MKILGSNYSLINGVAGGGGITGISVVKPGDADAGTLYQFNDGKNQNQDFSSFAGKAKMVVVADAGDTFTLTGSGWNLGGAATDDSTGIGGTLYKNNDGGQILISGGAKVNFGGATGSGSSGGATGSGSSGGDLTMAKDDIDTDINTIEADNPKGGIDSFVTRNEIKKAIDDGKFDGMAQNKQFWQDVITNIDNGKIKTKTAPDGNVKAQGVDAGDLIAAQNNNVFSGTGAGGATGSGGGTGASSSTINLEANLAGATNNAFGPDNKHLVDRVNWAIGNAGGTDKVAADGSILKPALEQAIKGLQMAQNTVDANKADQKERDQRQIDFIKTFLDK